MKRFSLRKRCCLCDMEVVSDLGSDIYNVEEEEWGEFICAGADVTPLSKMSDLLAEMRNEFDLTPVQQKYFRKRIDETDTLKKKCAELEATVTSLRQQLSTISQERGEEESLEDLENKLKKSAQLLLQGDQTHEDVVHELDEAIRQHPSYKERQAKAEKAWDEEQFVANLAAYEEQRRLVPNDIANSSKERILRQCEEAFGTSGRTVTALAARLFNSKTLWLVHFDSDSLERLHPVDLRDRYVIVGLDLVELRATYHTIQMLGEKAYVRDRSGLKLKWRNDLRDKLKSLLGTSHSLPKHLKRHSVYRNLGKHLLRQDSTKKNKEHDENSPSTTVQQKLVPSPPPQASKPNDASPRSRFLLRASDSRLNVNLMESALQKRAFSNHRTTTS